MLKDEVLTIVVTRNNPVLLQNFVNSYDKHNAGIINHLVIADNTSDNPRQLDYLNLLSKRFDVQTFENDRVEATFDSVSQKYINDYKYFFFLHDDSFIFKDNWLKVYVDKANSNYFEPVISNTHLAKYPIGRVASCHQPWRDFYTCKEYSLPSVFLKNCLEVLSKELWIYKYADQDRTLWTQKCLKENGLWSVKKFKAMEQNELFPKLVEQLNNTLQYPDEGIPPRDKYPAGNCWNKFTLLSEFLNSAWPLVNGYRTVGLEGDGYLEQIDGYDVPFGNNYVMHYGSPHTKKWLANLFKCSPEDVNKKLYSNDFSFILKCNKMTKEYFK